ncbi:MAG: ABC transporter ATP-binding protein [Halanaerobiales bacterium]
MEDFHEEKYNKRFDMNLWKKLFKYIFVYRKEMIWLAVVMIAVAGIDAVFPLLNKYVVDNFVVPETLNGVKKFALLYIVLVIMQAVNVGVFISLAGKIETGIAYDIRRLGFRKLQELSQSYFDKKAVGWLMARMTSDVRKLGETIAWGLVDLVWGFFVMFLIILIMLKLHFRLALLTLTVVPVLVFLSLYFQQKILKAYRQVRKTNSRITGSFNEGIMGAVTSKTLVREKENLHEFKDLTGKMKASSVRAAIFSALFLPMVLSLGSIGTALALWAGGNGVAFGIISYGTLVAFLSYTVRFFEPVREMARVFAELQSAQASAERVLSLVEAEPEIKDTQEIIDMYGDQFQPKKENWPAVRGKISFKNVSFYYKKGEYILKNFNLEIAAGETLALVGETGSGKSTIANLACRFYEPDTGEILIDGVDYRRRSQLWLQSNIGYVLQSPHLFSGTISENIAYGFSDINSNDVERAAKLVNAHELIIRMKDGYNTEIGESGASLSTGEKQLISFARAVLSDPVIFVLDEATSSIDTRMEQIIQKALQKLLAGRTNIIIAHRLSTIKSADRIICLKSGEIIESGSHQKLLDQKGYYYDLYTTQFYQSNKG